MARGKLACRAAMQLVQEIASGYLSFQLIATPMAEGPCGPDGRQQRKSLPNWRARSVTPARCNAKKAHRMGLFVGQQEQWQQ